MHLKRAHLHPESFPTQDHYPFNLAIFRQTRSFEFPAPVTFFVGENGTGKSTLLKALVQKCGIQIWGEVERRRFEINPYEEDLYRALDVEWTNGHVPGSFFSSQVFRNFSKILDEWAAATPAILNYFGGKSLQAGHAQFVVATHSPILLACPGARIYSFDHIPVQTIDYEETEHYRIYKDFLEDRHRYLDGM